MAWVFLSHILDAQTPAFGGKTGFCCQEDSRIDSGRNSNSSHFSFSNHLGTHVDPPLHFFNGGQGVDDLLANDCIFEAPFLLEVPIPKDRLIRVGEWLHGIPLDCDLLMIKTGFESQRNLETYWTESPGLHHEIGEWLRLNRVNVRAVGFDFLSLTSSSHREEGRAAHRAFLNPKGQGHPILIFEDMSLAPVRSKPQKVIAAPLRTRRSDGAPLTVLAWVE